MADHIAKIHRANTIYVFLKQQTEEYLDEQNISKCEKCKGLGLDKVGILQETYFWDGSSYCDECAGIGYKGVGNGMQVDPLHYICRNCAGLGCKSCNNGIVDWVDHSMGR